MDTVKTFKKNTYPFEEGAEVAERLTGFFGDLSGLCAADLGAGPGSTAVGSQVFDIPWRRLISVEAFSPYVQELRKRDVRTGEHEIVHRNIEDIFGEFKAGEIDLALIFDVIEHFPRRKALGLLRRLESFLALGVAIFVPLGRVKQDSYDGNSLQRHRSSWKAEDFVRLGYSVTVYEGMHGDLDPPVDGAWALKRWG